MAAEICVVSVWRNGADLGGPNLSAMLGLPDQGAIHRGVAVAVTKLSSLKWEPNVNSNTLCLHVTAHHRQLFVSEIANV